MGMGLGTPPNPRHCGGGARYSEHPHGMAWGPTSGTQVIRGLPRSSGALDDRSGSGVTDGGRRSASSMGADASYMGADPTEAHLTRGTGGAAAAPMYGSQVIHGLPRSLGALDDRIGSGVGSGGSRTATPPGAQRGGWWCASAACMCLQPYAQRLHAMCMGNMCIGNMHTHGAWVGALLVTPWLRCERGVLLVGHGWTLSM